jgi:hypothetical protein
MNNWINRLNMRTTKKLQVVLFTSLALLIFSCNNGHQQPVQPEKVKLSAIPGDTFHPPPPPRSRIDPADILKEKELKDYIKTSPSISPNKKSGAPFNTLDYDKVIAYDFDGGKPYNMVIDEDGKFIPVITKQQFLTQQQADKITMALSSKSTYGDGTAACFEPHLGLVFYKKDSIINQLSICLGCNFLSSQIPIPAETHKVLNKGKEYEYALTGFTKTGKQAIKALCKELNFYYGE